MPTANKILGQTKPAAVTPIILYTVPGGNQANVNIFASNLAGTSDAFRIAITKSGNALADKDYIAYGIPLLANSTLNFTGLALAGGDFITVYSTSGNISFNATGIEVS